MDAESEVRVIAGDWSGAARGAERKIWLAESRAGRLLRLENGRSRVELAEHLIALAEREPRLVVGLDFAFSFPAWYLEQSGLRDAHALWERMERDADGLLAACDWPF